MAALLTATKKAGPTKKGRKLRRQGGSGGEHGPKNEIKELDKLERQVESNPTRKSRKKTSRQGMSSPARKSRKETAWETRCRDIFETTAATSAAAAAAALQLRTAQKGSSGDKTAATISKNKCLNQQPCRKKEQNFQLSGRNENIGPEHEKGQQRSKNSVERQSKHKDRQRHGDEKKQRCGGEKEDPNANG